jgi:tetraacyldisaccharide 4'-kinase
MRARNRRFDTGRSPAIRLPVPVISVGNISLGGTGKTPFVEYLVRWLVKHGRRPVIVSRGYGSRQGRPNDEALELSEKLPGVPQIQSPDRVAAAREAIRWHNADMIVLDDGFQHRRLARDVDIVLIDATEPYGFGHVFPRGTLREPWDGLTRANAIVLTRSDLIGDEERTRIRSAVSQVAPCAIWGEAAHIPFRLRNANGKYAELATLAGKSIAAFGGLGNPLAFRRTLDSLGYQLVAWREFPDHSAYDATRIDELQSWVRNAHPEAVVCTHKDLVKIARTELADSPLWAVEVAISFSAGLDRLERLLRPLVAQELRQAS